MTATEFNKLSPKYLGECLPLLNRRDLISGR